MDDWKESEVEDLWSYINRINEPIWYVNSLGEKEVATAIQVFAYREEGRIDDAYQMGQKLMEKPRIDDMDIKAYGYSLMSIIKRDIAIGDESKIATYMMDLRTLRTIDDRKFEINKNKSLCMCNPRYRQIDALVQAKRYREAAPLARDAYKGNYRNKELERIYCQILFNVVKEEAMKLSPKGIAVKGYLDAYFGIQGESRLFFDKNIWNYISKLDNEHGDLNLGAYYLSTMKRRLPYEAYRGELKKSLPNSSKKGSDYWPSIYGRMTKIVLDYLCKCKDIKLINEVCQSVRRNEYKLNDNERWVITWNRGKVMAGCKDYAEARKCFLAVIKEKGNEYWVWSALGDTYIVEDVSLAISAYCRALLCKPPLKFGAPLKLKLAKVLVKENRFKEASIEVKGVLLNQREITKKSRDEAIELSQSSWFVPSIMESENLSFYKSYKNKVILELYNEIKWNTGMMLGTFMSDKKKLYKIAFDLNDGKVPIEVVLTKEKLDGIKFAEGGFVRAKLEWYTDARDCKKAKVLIIEETDPVENFLVMQSGIVEYINENKDVAHIRTECRDMVYLRDASSYGVKAYTKVKVSYIRHNGPGYSNKTAIHKMEILPEPKEIKITVRGRVTIDGNYIVNDDHDDYYDYYDYFYYYYHYDKEYGNIEDTDYTEYTAKMKCGEYSCLEGEENPVDDIKISYQLVEEHSLGTGVIVEGTALKCYGKDKYDTYWKLLDIVDLQYTNETDESMPSIN